MNEQTTPQAVESTTALDWKHHFTKVTPLSKFLAMLLFIALPFAGFGLGLKYRETLYFTQQTPADTVVTDTSTSLSLDKSVGSNEEGWTIIYEDANKTWYKPRHETEGCPRLRVIERNTGQDVKTELIGCPVIAFASSSPYFIEYAIWDDRAYDFKTLYATDLSTGVRKVIHTVQTGETTVALCREWGNFDPPCSANISLVGGVLSIDVFEEETHEPFSVYKNTHWKRTDYVSIADIFNNKTVQ